ncbi:PspC domain-containing protein [Micromonospora sp. WMMD1102]|uniref:PspC domain-containing protein n=1 Tax=Micromonospora sp. WMMD1102 TaxID=3016105 RepID=UPI0024154530|nr:PspC domain-containing protein [Micromonospora sp. WMMD1102]MDG4789859.1 PspC domain-containing protein [Micromonospora sp. WMMD1102]
MTQIPLSQPPYKQLRRPTTDRMIAGVASGLGRYFNVDPTLVRVVFAAIAVFTGGLGLLAYPVLWFLMPEEPADAPAWPHPPGTGPVWPPTWATRSPGTPAPPPPGTPAPPPPGAPAGTTGTSQPRGDGPAEVLENPPTEPRYPA